MMLGLALMTSLVLAAPQEAPVADVASQAPVVPVRAPVVAVVCPPELRAGLQPWLIARAAQGWQIKISEPAETPEATREGIRSHQLVEPYVLLVGDCPIWREAPNVQRQTPCFYQTTPVTERFGSTDMTATDLPYGDLDGDGMPESPVGRLPADDAAALERLVRRSLAAETNQDYGPWRRQVHLIAGVGGFGILADTAIEAAASGLIQSMLPPSVQTTVTYASPSSPFFPGYERFPQVAKQRYSQGGLAWVYIGHGQVTQLDRVPQRTGVPILTTDDMPSLVKPQQAPPVALMLACFTGAFDARADCFAEKMVLAEGGPVNAIAGARVTMPYGNAVFAAGLMDAWFQKRVSRMGDLVLHARQGLLRAEDPSRPKLLDMLAKAVSPTGDKLHEERVEHAALYNLFGDPTMTLRHPSELALETPAKAQLGECVEAVIDAPDGGRLIVELCMPLSRVRKPTESAGTASGAPAVIDLEQDLTVLDRFEADVDGGNHTATLRLPADVEGDYVVRGFLQSRNGYALGAKKVRALKRL